MAVLPQDQLQTGIGAVFRLFSQHVIRQGIEVGHGLLFHRVQVIQELFVGQDDGGRVVGIVHSFFVKSGFLVDVRVDEPFVRGVERVVGPAPAGGSAAQGVPVIGAEGSADIHEIRGDRILDDHDERVVHCRSPFHVAIARG